ncbi:hypothetical protein P5E53_15465, partial [Clostridium perfringens]|nr:hypothetical protein [Clostridium perfringens]
KNFTIRPAGKVKIFSAGQLPGNSGPYDIEANVASWGIGANITTSLINPSGDSRATHNQRTMYSS